MADIAALRLADVLVLSPTPTAPTDQGNRKRIHAICTELKRHGARVHFLHYPHEWWFSFAPMDLADEMRRQWDSFHLVPTTRPLHTRAAGDDHTIDEWWDPAIGDYLKWLFERQHFDAFIVNYTYLSKAFEYAPPHVLRILDTHDKFSHRRQLLEQNGIEREFFYTTPDQEAIALDRAQLVWAIKDEEAEFFRSISKTPCITMPHVEPRRRIARKRLPKDEGYLVIGMLGARNAINVSNARQFVDEVLPIFRSQLAPIRIRFAGGMCSALGDLANLPGVDVMGRVDEVEEFYEAVDVVVVPLAFSTGLKIKAVEAFASGMPIVAIGHALEGIPVDHACHRCTSMRELAEHCLALAYAPERLESLREATAETYALVEQQAAAAFEQTIARVRQRTRIVVTLSRRFFDAESLYREHVVQTLHYLRHLGDLVLYFDEPIRASQSSLFEQFNGLAALGKVALGPGSGLPQDRSVGMMSHRASLSEVLDGQGSTLLWMLRVPPEFFALPAQISARTPVCVRMDALRMFSAGDLSRLAEVAARSPKIRVLDAGGEIGITDLDGDVVQWAARVLKVPFWRWMPWQLKMTLGQSKRVDVLVPRAHPGRFTALAPLFESRAGASFDVRPVFGGPGYGPASNGRAHGVDIEQVASTLSAFGGLPRLVVDLTDGAAWSAPFIELMVRAKVPVVAMGAAASGGTRGLSARASTLEALARIDAALGDQHVDPADDDVRHRNDAGWNHAWKVVRALTELR